MAQMNRCRERYAAPGLECSSSGLLSCGDWGAAPSWHVLTSLKLSKLHAVGFLWRLQHTHNELHPRIPSSSVRLQFPKLLIMAWFSWMTSPHPEAIQEPTKSHLIQIRRNFYPPRNSKGFRSSVSGIRSKGQISKDAPGTLII